MSSGGLERLLGEIRACRVCVERSLGTPLPHQPRPVIRAAPTARLAICSQAPGVRVHASGIPFTDPSGDRLREWMGVTPAEFYDETRVAIVPMGFCFPGHDKHGGDLPPRRECAPLWRAKVLAELPRLELVLLVGSYAQRWHLPATVRLGMTDVVRNWQEIGSEGGGRRCIPLPHPSWRNNAWIGKHPWFEAELLPFLRGEVRRLLVTDLPDATPSNEKPGPEDQSGPGRKGQRYPR